jgi:hypothetical protein
MIGNAPWGWPDWQWQAGRGLQMMSIEVIPVLPKARPTVSKVDRRGGVLCPRSTVILTLELPAQGP